MKFIIIILLFISTILNANTIDLTKSEKDFIKKHPKIVLGIGEGWEPLAIKTSNGEVSGFDADILNEINKLTGANFVLQIDKWDKAQKKAQNKQTDGLSSVVETEKRKKYFDFSNVFNTMNIMIVTSKNNANLIKNGSDLKGKVIAVEKSNVSHNKIANSFDGAKILPVDTILDSYKKVLEGKADAAIAHNSFKYLMVREGLPKLEVAFQVGEELYGYN